LYVIDRLIKPNKDYRMKTLLIPLIIALSIKCEAQQEFDVEYVIKKFNEYSSRILKVEYDMHRIDTFPGGAIWDHKGIALIERNTRDELFGFSFYGKQDDMSTEFIYDNGIGFIVDKSSHSYEIEKAGFGFLGSPGGQMVLQSLFYLDSIYQSRSLAVSDNFFTITYEFQDDTLHDVTNIVKSIELTRDTFLPVKILRTAYAQGKRTATQTILSNIRINDQAMNSIKVKKSVLEDYKLIQREPAKPNPILGTRLQDAGLSNLFKLAEKIILSSNMPLLIDFWENWCGPCVASLPKVENLHRKYSRQLQVIGIIFQNKEEAIRLIEKKNITFQNAIGKSELMKTFSINSWPRYFLVDKNGIIQKEYYGYSEQIERDIKEMIE
jgi:thiol-disulfide isomerase/thioredoxin